MPNNPIQVVLNSKDFHQIPDNTAGGSVKDFYKDRDEAFAAHRDRLIGDIDQIARNLKEPTSQGIEYVHIILEEDAWAKTKRPTERVFPPDRIPLVGGGGLGNMIVELTPDNIDVVRNGLSKAETEVPKKLNRKTEKWVPNPSRARGEVGAIQAIRIHQGADRRKFSAEEALAWFKDPRTGGMYLVETFFEPGDQEKQIAPGHRARALAAYNQFKASLKKLNERIEIQDTGNRWRSIRLLLVKLESDDLNQHQRLLRYLDDQSIVRQVKLPPILSIENTHTERSAAPGIILPPVPNASYPTLGVIDTGIAKLDELEPWCTGRVELINDIFQDTSHGTFIAGISAAAHSLNAHDVFNESPCRFFDLGLHPTETSSYEDYYPRGFIDFLEQLDAELGAAKQSGARVFNMSLSIARQVADDGYSEYAAILDEIADRHDVLFVLPSGNLEQATCRQPWPNDGVQAAQMLAAYRYGGQDRLFQPAESVRAICVGALDPPDADNHMRPAVYTRRGPSTSLGLKPDVAHVGGMGGRDHGLISLSPNGSRVTGCGTSYASPFVGKALATIDHVIQGDVERETLVGILIHGAKLPALLDKKDVRKFALDFVGHGMPAKASDMLETSDNGITLAFTGQLELNRELVFPITWPASLVTATGGCRGKARLTLVYKAPTDRRFGAEYVRINLDAYLRQEHINAESGEINWSGRLKSEAKLYERHLIESGHKWWPIKRYEAVFPKGVGSSSQWQLVVDALRRTDTAFPEEGIPFAVLLTIEDPTGTAQVFNEVRRTLQASGANIAGIRTAQQIKPRV